jgi:CrcB protein
MVFVGAGLGAVLRHSINGLALRWPGLGLPSLGLSGLGLPVHTLFINSAGSFVMGLVAGWFAFRASGQNPALWQLFLTTGVLGGFTTFSAFSMETVLLWQRGQHIIALAYVGSSMILPIMACAAGLALVRMGGN